MKGAGKVAIKSMIGMAAFVLAAGQAIAEQSPKEDQTIYQDATMQGIETGPAAGLLADVYTAQAQVDQNIMAHASTGLCPDQPRGYSFLIHEKRPKTASRVGQYVLLTALSGQASLQACVIGLLPLEAKLDLSVSAETALTLKESMDEPFTVLIEPVVEALPLPEINTEVVLSVDP